MSTVSKNSKSKAANDNATSGKISEKGDNAKDNNIADNSKRQTLKVLQEKADKQAFKKVENKPNTLIGRTSGGFLKLFANEKSNNKITGKTVKIFEDASNTEKRPVSKTSCEPKPQELASTCTQTNLTGNDILDFEKTIEPEVQFYKDLAEKRREALNESLKENEELWIENEEQKEKVKTLEDKVHSLEETVEKARKLSELLEPYLDAEVEGKENDTVENALGEETESPGRIEPKPINTFKEETEEKVTQNETNIELKEDDSSKKESNFDKE